MKKPSVLFISRSYGRDHGTHSRLLEDLAGGFVTDGWDVRIITSAKVASVTNENGVRVKRIKSRGEAGTISGILTSAKLIMVTLKQSRPDLIITVSDPFLHSVIGGLVAKFRKARHIHWCHQIHDDLRLFQDKKSASQNFKFWNLLSDKYLPASSRIVATGRCVASYLIGKGIEPRQVAFIPNWPEKSLSDIPDSIAVQLSLQPARPVSRPLRVNNEPKFRVLYVGPVNLAHPVRTILDAASILQISNPEIEFTFIANEAGDEKGYEKLAQERTRRRLENIKLLPPQPASQWKEIYQSGDVHIISMNDGIEGMIVPANGYEVFAAERPCIFLGPVNSEIAVAIREFKAGNILSQGDPKSLAETIRLYRMDGSKWFDAHKGAAEANRCFSPENGMKNWLEYCRSAIKI